MSTETNPIVDRLVLEVARLTHRAIVAEVLLAEAQSEREQLAAALAEEQGGDAS